MIENNKDYKIAILGGTGKEGRGLAYRWAKAGFPIIIGSRNPTKAIETAEEIKNMLSNDIIITGTSNEQAAQNCQAAVLTVPYSAHKIIIESLKDFLHGKLFIDVTVPLTPPKVTKVQMPPAGSAAQESHLILGDTVLLAAAFHNISYENLLDDAQEINCDVLVTGTSKESRQSTLILVKAAGFFGLDAGPIENSVVLEGLTSILIGINHQYKSNHAGIRITGITRTD